MDSPASTRTGVLLVYSEAYLLPTRNRRHRILGLALDPPYIDGWVECCLERIGEDDSKEEEIFRDLWDDETQREVVVESLKAECEVRRGRPPGL